MTPAIEQIRLAPAIRGLKNALALGILIADGSEAAPGFIDPEGIVIFHAASGQLFKKTIKGDEAPKGITVPLASRAPTSGSWFIHRPAPWSSRRASAITRTCPRS